jgi:predicted RNase H-like nuclease (RuvC/YqgF family)
MHDSKGDGFFNRDHSAEHERRQRARASLSTPSPAAQEQAATEAGLVTHQEVRDIADCLGLAEIPSCRLSQYVEQFEQSEREVADLRRQLNKMTESAEASAAIVQQTQGVHISWVHECNKLRASLTESQRKLRQFEAVNAKMRELNSMLVSLIEPVSQ